MKPVKFATTPPDLFRRLTYSQKTVWGVVVMSILVCAVIAWLHFHQQQTFNRALKALNTFRQARIDLINGFLHLTLGDDPASPFDQKQGQALLEQAIVSFDSSNLSFDQQGLSASQFQANVQAFRQRLDEWNPTTATLQDETELRIGFEQLEGQAERLDEATRAQLQALFQQQEIIFNWALGGAAVLLTGVCGAVFLAGQARLSAEAERQQVEAALRQSEARYRLIAANTNDVIWLLNMATGKFIYVSPSVQKLRGYTPEEVLTQTMADALTPESLALVSEAMSKRLEQFYAGNLTAQVNITEVNQPRKDGSIVQTEVVTTLLTDDQGQVTEILGVTRDITVRKRAEEAVLVSKAKLEAALASMTDAVFISDAAGRFIEVNEAFATFHKFRNKQECFQTLNEYPDILDVYMANGELVPPDQWVVPRALRGETVTNAEYSLRRKDTGETWVGSYSFGPIRDHDGAVVGSVVVGRDVTELKQAEAKLRESEEWLRLAYDAAELGIWRNDIASDMYSFDTRAREHYGLELTEIATGEIIRRIYPDDMERLQQEIAATIDPASSGRFATEYRVVHLDGTVHWLAVQARVIFEGEGETRRPVMGYGTSQDITARKQAEADLVRTMEELKRSNADLEQFAYAASHDLQEPLRAVVGMLTLLQKRYGGQLDERADEFIRHAVEGASRMQTLINDLLVFSRVGTRGQPFKSVDSAAVLADALANLAVAIRESGAVIGHDNLPTVVADRSQLIQLFQNLIGNAIKFRGEKVPDIRIRAERQQGEWLFAVADNGIGLEAQYYERIFGVFQRLHTRREYPGTGIGLALCKKIVERHGGRIWVESEPGQGATFYFTLPARKTVINNQ